MAAVPMHACTGFPVLCDPVLYGVTTVERNHPGLGIWQIAGEVGMVPRPLFTITWCQHRSGSQTQAQLTGASQSAVRGDSIGGVDDCNGECRCLGGGCSRWDASGSASSSAGASHEGSIVLVHSPISCSVCVINETRSTQHCIPCGCTAERCLHRLPIPSWVMSVHPPHPATHMTVEDPVAGVRAWQQNQQ
jgi:hypothetical protein